VPDEPVGARKPRFQNTITNTNTVMKCCCHSVVVLQTNTVMTNTNTG